MGFWDRVESSGKKFTAIVGALGTVIFILCKIYLGIVKLNEVGEDVIKNLSVTKEQTKFIGYQIDMQISDADRVLSTTGTLPKDRMDSLILYRDTLPSIITYKQKIWIDHIEKKYYRSGGGGEK